jgi:hypothetical protein
MGYIGSLLGEAGGKALGNYLSGGNKTAEEVGGGIGKFAGSYLPFAKGGKVKRHRSCRCGCKGYRKGGGVQDDSDVSAMSSDGYAMGGRVMPDTRGNLISTMPVPRNYGDKNPMLF